MFRNAVIVIFSLLFISACMSSGSDSSVSSQANSALKSAATSMAGENNTNAVDAAINCNMDDAQAYAEKAQNEDDAKHKYAGYIVRAALYLDMDQVEKATEVIDQLAGNTEVNTDGTSKSKLTQMVDKQLETIRSKREEATGKETCE